MIVLCALGMTQGSHAQTAGRTSDIDHQVKAAYLYKFANFVEWPPEAFANADSQLVIGVIEADALADEMAGIVTRYRAGGRKLTVRKLRRGDPVTNVHMLFIGSVERSRLQEIYAAVAERPILTVSDSEEEHASGSMINFVIVDERLRFEVALKPVGASRLKISALMLAAAYKVVKGGM